eukprot:Gb_09251 [translate_table: standard]
MKSPVPRNPRRSILPCGLNLRQPGEKNAAYLLIPPWRLVLLWKVDEYHKDLKTMQIVALVIPDKILGRNLLQSLAFVLLKSECYFHLTRLACLKRCRRDICPTLSLGRLSSNGPSGHEVSSHGDMMCTHNI